MTAPAKVVIGPAVQTVNLQLKVVGGVEQVTVEDRAVSVTPEPANNASATVLGGDDLQALSDNPDDLIAELMAIAGPGAGPGGASVFIDGFSGGQAPSKESIREIRINQNPRHEASQGNEKDETKTDNRECNERVMWTMKTFIYGAEPSRQFMFFTHGVSHAGSGK